MARKAQPGDRRARKVGANRIGVRLVAADKENGSTCFRPREPIPPKLQRFDPRIVELVRLLARETAREAIEQSLREAEAHNNPETQKD